ncbi:hypothetical protein EVAR_94937_1 [Eumeta japonica]|uniref:Uncharacterized protein n=1 Tax=Eumeta variegata TaxID=151549 RepID=A0A4C1TPS5_EUMVA|nr:hypothetical protein EVAR_94937_1 [Eumeta japonica]
MVSQNSMPMRLRHVARITDYRWGKSFDCQPRTGGLQQRTTTSQHQVEGRPDRHSGPQLQVRVPLGHSSITPQPLVSAAPRSIGHSFLHRISYCYSKAVRKFSQGRDVDSDRILKSRPHALPPCRFTVVGGLWWSGAWLDAEPAGPIRRLRPRTTSSAVTASASSRFRGSDTPSSYASI